MNGTRTHSFHSLGVPGHALAVGELLTPQPRSCASSFQFRFFEAAGLAMLATLIQRYKVEPHPKFAGESFEKLKERYSENDLDDALNLK